MKIKKGFVNYLRVALVCAAVTLCCVSPTADASIALHKGYMAFAVLFVGCAALVARKIEYEYEEE